MTQTNYLTGEACSFQNDAAAVLQRLRGSLAAVVAAVPPGGMVSKAVDLQRALNLDKKLSWKLFKVIRASEPLSAGPHVPGPANLADFLKAAAQRGVPRDLIAAAAKAGDEFQQVVEVHAGDRVAFDSMIDGLIDADNEQINLQHKRAAFRANRHIWGVQLKTRLYCVMVQPDDNDPSRVSVAAIQGHRELQRLRPGGTLILGHVSFTDDAGSVRTVNRRPLDPEVPASDGIALLPRFCSQPLPRLTTVRARNGVVYCKLLNDGLGKRSAVTLMHGYTMSGAGPRGRGPDDEVLGTTVTLRFPCETLISDLLVREDTFGPLQPSVRVYGERAGEPRVSALPDENDLIPLRESAGWVGQGTAALHTPDLPGYPEMARWVFGKLGWDGERFDVYRCRIEYPVMPSTVVMDASIPEWKGEPAGG